MINQTSSISHNAGAKLVRFLILASILGGAVMLARMLIAVSLLLGLFGGILFLAAGRLDWVEAWIVIGLYASFLLCSMIWGAIYAPDLMRERSRIPRNVKAWDQALNGLYLLTLAVLLLVAGLDARYSWSKIPDTLQGLGILGTIGSSYVIWLTMRENVYLSRWARIQSDRGQKVVSSGPYRYVRHPMYASIIFLILSMTLVLGSWWAFVPMGLVLCLYIIRTRLEDRMLYEELEGYVEYAQKVHYRLVPGIW